MMYQPGTPFSHWHSSIPIAGEDRTVERAAALAPAERGAKAAAPSTEKLYN